MPENNRAFLLFTIGPVQDFIATARRTHDLWAGSRLLSLLMIAALEKACVADAEPIFPLRNQAGNWPKSVPNRAVLAVSSTDVGRNVGKLMGEAVHEAWQQMAVSVKKRFSAFVPHDVVYEHWDELWETQNENWLEQYWITWPMTEAYAASYRAASDMLDARKRLRPISPRIEEGEKCTLSGVMAALPGPKANRDQMREFWRTIRLNIKEAKTISDTAVRSGEQLCSVSIVKRFAEADTVLQDKKRRFPSTSSLAAADFRLALLQNWPLVKKEVEAWMDAADKLQLPTFNTPEPIGCLLQAAQAAATNSAESFLKYDGDYLFSDFYTESRILEAWGEDKQGQLKKEQKQAMKTAANSLRALYSVCQQLEPPIALPSPYYAVLKMDGDRMGKTLSDKIQDMKKHREFSSRLAAFAQNDVFRLVEEESPGAVVFAGGDDVLALLPVSQALPVAEALRLQFSEKLSDNAANGWGELHASTGIVFIHHQAPLQTAVQEASMLEKVAKSKHGYNRNALAVKLLRRSGEPHEMGSHWLIGSQVTQPVATLMEGLRKSMVGRELATKFAYEVVDNSAALDALPPKALKVEMGRLLKRHWDERQRNSSAAQAKIRKFSDDLVAIAISIPPGDLGRWLLLVAFLAKRGGDV